MAGKASLDRHRSEEQEVAGVKFHRAISLLVALSAACCWASDRVDHAAAVKELKERVAAAQEKDRARLQADLVSEEVELANDLFTAGNVAQAQQTVTDLRASLAGCRANAVKYGRNLKHIDIVLREAARRLDDVRRSLAFEDQPPLKDAVAEIQEARSAILDRMFAPKETHK